MVWGDSSRLRQVLLNLIGNAIKFTDSGWIAIRGELLEDKSEFLRVRLIVQDTGIGIPEAEQQRLFSPFSQIDASSTRRFGGTGLGLAISKQLVELMGGQIGQESTAGVGSTFWVELPLYRAAAIVLSRDIPSTESVWRN